MGEGVGGIMPAEAERGGWWVGISGARLGNCGGKGGWSNTKPSGAGEISSQARRECEREA